MGNEITTIQLRENVKEQLDRLKIDRETYEEVILRLMQLSEKQKRKQENLLIEECKIMAKDNLKTLKEFSAVDKELDWGY